MPGTQCDGREVAVLAAHRLHVVACHAAGADIHFGAEALSAAGWLSADTREVMVRGAVARHSGLNSISSEDFQAMTPTTLRRLQRGGTAGHATSQPGPDSIRPEWLDALRCRVAAAPEEAEWRVGMEMVSQSSAVGTAIEVQSNEMRSVICTGVAAVQGMLEQRLRNSTNATRPFAVAVARTWFGAHASAGRRS